MTARGTWKRAEREIAELLTAALNTVEEYGQVIKRNILSGANNRRDDGSPRPGDVVLPTITVNGKSEPVYDLHVEHKYRASHAHQTLLEEAQADGLKHGLNNTLLITKVKGQHGHTAVMDLELLLRLLAVPEARAILKRSLDGPSSRSHKRASRKRSTPPPQDPDK